VIVQDKWFRIEAHLVAVGYTLSHVVQKLRYGKTARS
jgi:hypothetical protein